MARRPGFFRSGSHRSAAQGQRGDFAAAGVGVQIDLRQLRKLERAMKSAGLDFRRRDKIIVRALNRASMRLQTRLKRALQRWTGIKRQSRIVQDFRPIIASTGKWRAGTIVAGKHLRITSANFGATWSRRWAGGRHRAWNRPRTADGSFMAFSGRGGGKFGGGLLFTRTSSSRLPIVPLWGPSLAREVERHRSFVRALTTQQARWVLPEMARQADVAIKRAKARYGL